MTARYMRWISSAAASTSSKRVVAGAAVPSRPCRRCCPRRAAWTIARTRPSPTTGLIPYEPIAAFWSDGASEGALAGAAGRRDHQRQCGDGDFLFPNGTVLMKHFRLAGQLVETRLFMRHPDGEWAGYSYEWDAQETDATLVVGGKTAKRSTGRRGCSRPVPSASSVIPRQRDTASAWKRPSSTRTSPTRRRAARPISCSGRWMRSCPVQPRPWGIQPDQPALADPNDENASLDDRARAYLHTNCSGCHRPGGPPGRNLDLRYQTDPQRTPMPATWRPAARIWGSPMRCWLPPASRRAPYYWAAWTAAMCMACRPWAAIGWTRPVLV